MTLITKIIILHESTIFIFTFTEINMICFYMFTSCDNCVLGQMSVKESGFYYKALIFPQFGHSLLGAIDAVYFQLNVLFNVSI